MRHLKKRIGLGLLAALVGVGTVVVRSQGRPAGEWRYYGGDHAFTRYAPLDQITRDNVKNLKIAWRRPAVNATLVETFPDLRVSPYLKSTPIVLDGVIYTQNAHGLVTAFDGTTGTTIWEQEAPKEEAAGDPTRGLDSWSAGSDRRIIAIRGEYLYALDATTGKPSPDFGDHGRVSLHFGDPQPLAGKFTDTSGAIVVGNVVVVAGYTNGAGDGGNKKERARDDVRGYDVRTGKLLWTFHVVPQQGEPGTETWGNESWKYAGDLGAWNPLSADDELGYVYLPLTAPTSAAYGGWRPGDNLYSNSLVALDAKTGKRVWHFQMVHHDLWEWDNVGPPTLGDITVNGRRIKAVMQPNKNGFLYVLDRTNGKPVWPIEERPVPASTVPGERISPTQPFPTKPPAFDRQGFTEEDLIDFTPELRAQALEVAKQYVHRSDVYAADDLESRRDARHDESLQVRGARQTGTPAPSIRTPACTTRSRCTLPAAIAVTSTAGNAEATMDYQWGSRPATEREHSAAGPAARRGPWSGTADPRVCRSGSRRTGGLRPSTSTQAIRSGWPPMATVRETIRC